VPLVRSLTDDQFYALLRPGLEVFCAGCAGESSVFLEWLTANPACARGVRFTGVWIPGVNRFDFSALDPSTRMRGLFLSADFAAAFARDQFDFLHLPYSAMYAWLKTQRFDLAMVQTGALDVQGNFPLALAADFSSAALINARQVLLHANPALPATNGPFVPRERADWVVEGERAPLEFDSGPVSKDAQQAAAHVATLIEDGSTLQFGLGKMQAALCETLSGRRDLRVHSGMVSTPLLKLLDSGQIAKPDRFKPPIVTGVGLGNAALYERLAHAELVRFAQVGYTHDIATLKQIQRFVSVNSVLEVDLFGQANGEYLNGALVSGAGGMLDFVRGARAAANGRSVLALTATAAGGTRSRIVVQLKMPATVSRADVDWVATEFGLAQLRDLDSDARAHALIELAAPAFRDELRRGWSQLRRVLRGIA